MIVLWLLWSAAGACIDLVWAFTADSAPSLHSDAAASSVRPTGVAPAPLMRLERSSHHSGSALEVDGEEENYLLKTSHISSVKLHDQDPEDTPVEYQMALLAKATYDVTASAPPVAGWTLQAQWSKSSYFLPGTDYLALWRRNDSSKCALVFAPTNQLESWTSGSQEHLDSDDCGQGRVHKGFFNEFQEMVGEAHWGTSFVPTLTSDCSEALFAVGHGFGGALASIYAACAAEQKRLNAPGITIPALFANGEVHKQDYFANLPPTSGLYTYGAPGVSHEQIQSPAVDDNSFAGARFYLEDETIIDATPHSGYLQGWIHPRVAAVCLRQETSGWVTRVEHMAATESAMKEPTADKTPDPTLHPIDKYISRLQVAPMISGISRPGLSAVTAVARGGYATNTLTSTLYGVSGNRTGEPEPDRERMYVNGDHANLTAEKNCAAATNLLVGGAVMLMHLWTST